MSSIIGLLGGIAGFVKVRYLHDKAIIDNPVFRLHYRVTSAFFFATCILITAFDLFGKPIDCITSFPFSRPDALNTYCWTHSTFTLVRNTSGIHPTAHPNVGPQFSGDEKRYHSYYQWVPFVLFLQGILFYLPHWIWKQVESGKIRNITEGCRGHNLGDPTGRQTRCSAVSIYLRETLYSHGRFATAYITCEVLNFVNTLGNMFLINKFLNGAFMRYGSKVIQFSEEDPEFRFDPMIEVFPRMTKCTFHQFGPSGTIQVSFARLERIRELKMSKFYFSILDFGRSMHSAAQHRQREDLHFPLVLAHLPVDGIRFSPCVSRPDLSGPCNPSIRPGPNHFTRKGQSFGRPISPSLWRFLPSSYAEQESARIPFQRDCRRTERTDRMPEKSTEDDE